jgi:GcrA cell cycle regulator
MASTLNSPWADERVTKRLRVLWSDHSATQICGVLFSEFGVSLSRNAVVGRLHREGLTVEQKRTVHPLTRGEKKPKGQPRLRVVRANSNSTARRMIVTHTPAQLRELRCIEIISLGKALIDLEPNDCRYPYGDGPFTHCGHPQLAGRPYCPGHVALALRERAVA